MAEKLSNLSRVLFDKKTGEFLVGNDIAYDGQTVIFQYVQSTPSGTWLISLPFESRTALTFVFEDNLDGTYTEVKPEITFIAQTQVEIKFNTPVQGVANILLATEVITTVPATPSITPSTTPVI
jgi:hypothetical protein